MPKRASKYRKQNDGDLSLNAVNLFIERKVDEGVKELKKKFWPYTIGLIVLGGCGMWGLFKGIKDEIQKSLTSSYVAATLNDHIEKFTDEKVATVADSRIAIAETRIIDGFEKKVAEQEVALAQSSMEAKSHIESLQAALDVMKKAYDARGGDRNAFDEISLLAKTETEAGEIAAKIVREIEASYLARKEKESIGFLGDIRHVAVYNGNNGKHGPISLAHATMIIITRKREFEEGAISRIVDSAQKEFVEVLMLAVLETTKLDSVYLALRGIEQLAGVSFPVLGVEEAKTWWDSNKDNPEYHSPYATVFTALLRNQLQAQPNEPIADYYKRVIIPIYNAVISKPDLGEVAKIILPFAFEIGVQLNGRTEDVDCIKISKDLISRLNDDSDSRRVAFRYTISTMVYENVAQDTIFNFIIRAVKAHPDYLQDIKDQAGLPQEFKTSIENTILTLTEHTKNIKFYCVMNPFGKDKTQIKSPISDESDTLHHLDLIIQKDKLFIVRSLNGLEIPVGELGDIPFKTEHKEGKIVLLNDNGNPVIFDLIVYNEAFVPASGE